MDKDRIVGSAKDIAGKVEGAVGESTGNAQTQATGRAREAAGTVQNLYGQAKDAARNEARPQSAMPRMPTTIAAKRCATARRRSRRKYRTIRSARS